MIFCISFYCAVFSFHHVYFFLYNCMELVNLSTDFYMLVDWSMDIAVEKIIDSSTATYAIQQSTGSSATQNGSHCLMTFKWSLQH